MKGKAKSIKRFWIENYIMIFVYTIVCVGIVYVGMFIFVEQIMFRGLIPLRLEASQVYDEEELFMDDVISIHGWVELLDKDKQVIQVLGEKQDDIMAYQEDDLLSTWVYYTKSIDDYPYVYSVYIVPKPKADVYYCVVKVPREYLQLIPDFSGNTMPRANLIIRYFAWPLCIAISLLLFAIGLSIFSKRVSKSMQIPLDELKDAMEAVGNETYTSTVKYNSLVELNEVKNGFNNMSTELKNANHQKEAIKQSKQRMLVNIAHDLKTPMTSIQGFAYGLSHNHFQDKEEKEMALTHIYNKSVLMSGLINNLFELSKLQDIEYQLSLKKVNITEWLRQWIIKQYLSDIRNHVHIDIDILEEPILVKMNSIYMERALSNVIDNSLKYNSENIRITLRLYKYKENVCIEIADNGVGIDKKDRVKIFEPFMRSQTEENHEGSGLGLAISKEIIEKHKGSITLINSMNYSTCFKIMLPVYIK